MGTECEAQFNADYTRLFRQEFDGVWGVTCRVRAEN